MKVLSALAALILAATVAGPALADGGYYTGAVGPRAAGRGGAFVARADDLTATSINPAGLSEIEGNTFQVGNQFAYYGYAYTRAPTVDYGSTQNPPPTVTFTKVSNGTPWQAALPFLGAASRFGLRDWAFAASVFAPPGISREQFPPGGGQDYMMVGREAIILKTDVSAAWRFHDLFGIGLTVEWITVPRLDYSLIINGNPAAGGTVTPVSGPLDILAQTTGSDWLTFNAIVGGWFRPRPWLEFGLAGQVLPANIVTKSNLTLIPADQQGPLGSSPVTTERQENNQSDVKITLPLPLMARAGARYRHLRGGCELYDVELDAEYETWSRVKAFTLDTNGLFAEEGGQRILLGQIQIAKRWNDVFSVKLGGDLNLIPDRWTVRAGAYYETAVAPAAYANVDFPGANVFGAALGGSLLLQRLEIALTYQLRYQPSFTISEADGRFYQQVPCVAAPSNPSTCASPYAQTPPTVNGGTYAATSHLVSLAVIYRYGR